MVDGKKKLLEYKFGTLQDLHDKLVLLFKNQQDASEDDDTSWLWHARRVEEFIQAALQDANFVLTSMEESLLGLLAAENFDADQTEFQKRITLIAVVLGISLGTFTTYSFEEIKNVFAGKQTKYEILRFLRSLIETAKSENAVELSGLTANHLASNPDYHGSIKWLDVVLFTILAQASYARFEGVSQEVHKTLLTSCFYHAMHVKVPVEQALQKTLYNTPTILSYITLCSTLTSLLADNQEAVPLSDGSSQPLSAILQEYLNLSKEQWPSEQEQTKYFILLNNKIPKPAADVLRHALNIFLRLKNAKLTDRNRGGELSEIDRAFNNTIELVTWFGLGSEGIGDIKNYFQQARPLVPLRVFLNRLKEIVDLKNDTTVENIVELTGGLHSSGLLSKEQDIIIFDAKNGQFYWNESLIT